MLSTAAPTCAVEALVRAEAASAAWAVGVLLLAGAPRPGGWKPAAPALPLRGDAKRSARVTGTPGAGACTKLARLAAAAA